MKLKLLVAGAGDTLYANDDNSLMAAGVVTIGYFPDGVNDKNGDGVSNGLAFLLGAANPDANALGLLPAPVPQPGGGLVLNFKCLPDASRGGAMLYVEHSADLGVTDPWAASAAVTDRPGTPVNGVMFEVTPGTPLNTVKATISSTEAVAGKLFGRLRAEKP